MLVPANPTAYQPQPYDVYTVFPLQYVERLDEDAVLTKTPSPRVLSEANGGIVVSALPNGRVVGLVNPDTQTSATAWSKLIPPKFDLDGGMDDASDSIAIDCVVDQRDNFYVVTMNRNNLTNNGRVYGTSVSTSGSTTSATPLTWGPAGLPWLNLHSNIRFLELFQTSVTLTAAADGPQFVVAPLASMLDLNGVAFIPAGGATASQSCDPTGQPVSQGTFIQPCNSATGTCCMRTASMGVDGFGTFTGNAYVDGQGALGLIAYGFFKKDAAAKLYDASTGAVQASSTSVQFIAATDQSDPFVNPWNQRVYWLGWSGSAKTGDGGVLMYCVQASQQLAACPGYTPTDSQGMGGGNSVDFSSMWPNTACVITFLLPACFYARGWPHP